MRIMRVAGSNARGFPSHAWRAAAAMLLATCMLAGCSQTAGDGSNARDGARSASGSGERPIPQFISKDGKHALLVDGEPF